MATRAEFEEAMSQDRACYVFYTDKEHNMHYVADVAESIYTESLKDAFLFTESEAYAIKFLFDFISDDIVHHIVKLHTKVEWL